MSELTVSLENNVFESLLDAAQREGCSVSEFITGLFTAHLYRKTLDEDNKNKIILETFGSVQDETFNEPDDEKPIDLDFSGI